MAITGVSQLGRDRLVVTVDHDPAVTPTDAPAGSLIIDAAGNHYLKQDAGSSTNVFGFAGVSGATALHAGQHENGGSDEMDLTGLSGLLADPQDPVAHAIEHVTGGSDIIANASGASAGLLAASDKTKLDGVATGATNTPLSDTAPANVTKSTALEGVSTEASRRDHKHDVATADPGSITVGAVAAEGASTSLARADHTHGLAAPAVPANVTKAAASAGAATTVARSDHKHDVSTAAPAATGVATAAGEGAATSLARSDHTHQSNTAPADVTKAAAVIGTSGEPARADHKHDVTTAAPSSAIGTDTANGEGSAASLARSDHSHEVNLPFSQAVTTGDFTTSSATDVLVTGTDLTPAAGTYLVIFNASGELSSGAQWYASLYLNGAQVAGTEQTYDASGSDESQSMAIAYVLVTPGAQVVAIRVRVDGGTATVHNRTMMLVRIG